MAATGDRAGDDGQTLLMLTVVTVVTMLTVVTVVTGVTVVTVVTVLASRYLVKHWHQIKQLLPGGGRVDGGAMGRPSRAQFQRSAKPASKTSSGKKRANGKEWRITGTGKAG